MVRSPVRGAPAPLSPNDTATANVGAHTRRALLRVVGLLAVDVGTLELLRGVLALVGAPALLGAASHAQADSLPIGFPLTDHAGLALLVALWLTGSYGPADRRRDAGRVACATLLAVAIPRWDALWLGEPQVLQQFALGAALLATALVAARTLLDQALVRVARGRVTRTVLVGPTAAVEAEWRRRSSGAPTDLGVVAQLALPDDEGAHTVLARLEAALAEHRADTVLLCGDVDEATFTRIVRAAATCECRVLAVTRRLDMPGLRPSIVHERGTPMVELRAAGLRGQQLVLKRLLDICGATILLVAFAPLMAAVALAVRLGGRGPVVYAQARLGRHGRSFRCLKFRSMYPDAEQRLQADEALYAEYVRNGFKLPDGSDPRIMPIGRLLRRTSLDELPQLWNVLRGDMSLVGPRPIVPREICHYEGDEHMLLLLKPGITGSWQVSGRSNVGYPERSRLELDYVEGWSLGRDISILLRTAPAVLLQRGAH